MNANLSARHRLSRRIAGAAIFCGLALAPVAASALTIDEVITLVKLDISEDQIIKKIDKDGTVFKLAPSDILKLKKAGVSDKVIRHMMKTASRGAAPGSRWPRRIIRPASSPSPGTWRPWCGAGRSSWRRRSADSAETSGPRSACSGWGTTTVAGPRR